MRALSQLTQCSLCRYDTDPLGEVKLPCPVEAQDRVKVPRRSENKTTEICFKILPDSRQQELKTENFYSKIFSICVHLCTV
jgi:hypothetical protein